MLAQDSLPDGRDGLGAAGTDEYPGWTGSCDWAGPPGNVGE